MKIIWIVAHVLDAENNKWKFIGSYSTEELAVEAAKFSEWCCVCPSVIDGHDHENDNDDVWEGAYYPADKVRKICYFDPNKPEGETLKLITRYEASELIGEKLSEKDTYIVKREGEEDIKTSSQISAITKEEIEKLINGEN